MKKIFDPTVWAGAIAIIAVVGLAGCAPAATSGTSGTSATSAPAQAPAIAPYGAPTTGTSISGASTTGTPNSSGAATGAFEPGPSTTPGAPADAAVKVARVQGFGLFLTDNADRTLYAFAKDTKDTSNCTGTCMQNWPPFIVHGTPTGPSNINPALLTTFSRQDGSLQAEYDGHPLYYYAGDKAPGDVKGQGIGGNWHVLSPRGNPMMNPYGPGATATP